MADVSFSQVSQMVQLFSTMNWESVLATMKARVTADDIRSDLIDADIVLEIIGAAVPPVAIVANDLKLAISIESMAEPFIIYFGKKYPAASFDGKINVWGQPMEPVGLFQTIGTWFKRKYK